MQRALVDGVRRKAEPGLVGYCELCGSRVIPHCGPIVVDHWKHKSKRDCDSWSEPEGPWHQSWKAFFPKEWEEVVITGENGKQHRADLYTDEGWVIELQHSRIKPEDRAAREEFYGKMIWIVDGNLRKTYPRGFEDALRMARSPIQRLPQLRMFTEVKGRLLEQWIDRPVHVFLDFGGALWWLIPKGKLLGRWFMPVGREFVIQSFGPVDQRPDETFHEYADALFEEMEKYQRR